MEQQDKETINSSLPELTRGEASLDLNESFLRLLQHYKIFNSQMIEDIVKNENPRLELCMMLVRRGPDAFKNFVKALSETNQLSALAVLSDARLKCGLPPLPIPIQQTNCENVDRNMNGSPADTQPLSPHTREFMRRVLEPPNYLEGPSSPIHYGPVTDAAPPDYNILNIQVKLATEFRGAPDGYPNRCIKPRGMALILNYQHFVNAEERVGSEKDVIHLDQLLQQLGYSVTLRTDLSLLETYKELDAFSKCPDHEQSDSTVVAIMSHGKGGNHNEGTLIFTTNGSYVPSEDILSRFNNTSCPLLKGKPKIFLFQFCRGDSIDQGLRAHPMPLMGRTVTDGNPVPQVQPIQYERSFDDMLIAYSTLPGYVSYREESEGTWFIKALCLIFMEEACIYHVDRLLQRVDEVVKGWTGSRNGKQTLEITRRGFNKKFYFNPGLWRIQ